MTAPGASTALLTDHYELTMLASALADGSAQRECVFEVFARRLPDGRRYGVVAGTTRVLEAIANFRFDEAELEHLAASAIVPEPTLEWLANYRFTGDIDGYPEGELYFPGSPVLTVRSTFAEGVVLETLVLSILNHDSAVASAAARMVTAAGSRPIIEMGGRRTHEQAAVAAARAAYLGGFAATSNLEAGRQYGIPTRGTVAHAFMLLHDSEEEAFRAQVQTQGTDTTLLVDTYDITRGVETAVRVAGPELGAVRIDSGDVGVLARQVRDQLDRLGNTDTRIVVSGDLDEHAAERALESIGVVVNKNRVPGDSRPAAVTSGVRIGTNAVAQRGLGPNEMRTCAGIIHSVLTQMRPDGDRDFVLDEFTASGLRAEVDKLTAQFPLPRYGLDGRP